jgi:hypothetical protein
MLVLRATVCTVVERDEVKVIDPQSVTTIVPVIFVVLQLFPVMASVYVKGLPTLEVGVPDSIKTPLVKALVTPGGNVPTTLTPTVSTEVVSVLILPDMVYRIGIIAVLTATVCESVPTAESRVIWKQVLPGTGTSSLLQEKMTVIATANIAVQRSKDRFISLVFGLRQVFLYYLMHILLFQLKGWVSFRFNRKITNDVWHLPKYSSSSIRSAWQMDAGVRCNLL